MSPPRRSAPRLALALAAALALVAAAPATRAADAGAAPPDAGAERSPRENLVMARELAGNAQLTLAIRHASLAVRDATEQRDDATLAEARELMKTLMARIPHVTFDPPDDVTDLHVTFDERPVPTAELKKWFSVDPGRHAVHASGLREGAPVAYDGVVDLVDAERRTIVVTMTAQPGGCLTCGDVRCLSEARSEEEAQACIAPARTKAGCRACLVAPAGERPAGLVALALPLAALALRRAARVSGSRARAGGRGR